MRILFIGDIFGRTGREGLEKHLPNIKEQYDPTITIVNGENAAHGAGITEKICKEFYGWGVDVITTGNHVWDQREVLSYITRDKNLLRPANYPEGTPGKGLVEWISNEGKKVVVINMMARLFMDPLDDPFQKIDALLKPYKLGQNVDAIFVDLHGEATSEKMAFAHHLDGRVTGVIGTHTHIPTADHHVMVGGTAFQSDAGMTGSYDSVIGVDKHIAIHRFLKKTPSDRPRPDKSEATVCGAIIDVSETTGLAVSIAPIRVGGILSQSQKD